MHRKVEPDADVILIPSLRMSSKATYMNNECESFHSFMISDTTKIKLKT